MKIHHLSCGTMCPFGGGLVDGEPGWLRTGHMVCHCLLVETNFGLVLVDTGLGRADVERPVERLGRLFMLGVRPVLSLDETALSRVEALGFSARDVRHIVPTHMDLDHVGGLSDFPDAEVHVFSTELRAALDRPTRHERFRYRPAQWSHNPRWRELSEGGESWMGLRSIRAIGDEILLIPLIGHSRGHVGVAVRDGDGWLLHAGDAYFHHREMDAEPFCPPALKLFQTRVAFDDATRLQNQARLRELARKPEIRVFSAHSPVELSRF
jgi:glyoxylase-like metal-dependent hydrolase (beta-lactamase superfamily II)